MDSTTELAALVRRLSPRTHDRLLLLLHCLLYAAGAMEEGKTDMSSSSSSSSPVLSLRTIWFLLLSACPGAPPRFLFALSGNDKLIRSADGGLTWRVSFSRTTEAVAPAASADASADDVLKELQGLLVSATADVEDDVDATTAATTASTKPLSAILSAHGYEEVVALCGRDNFLAVSGDRGVTFTTATKWLAAGLTLDAPLQHVCVLDGRHLVVSDGMRVLRIDVEQVGYGRVALGTAKVVLTCTTQIVLLQTYSTVCGGRAVLVSERGALHLSLDGGATFLEVRHTMGQIRGVDPLDAVRRAEQPALPADLVSALCEVAEGDGATKPSNPSSPSYAYLSGYRRDVSANTSQRTALHNFEHMARRHKKGIFYQRFLVSGCGTEVLPYDYTAVLCVCTQRKPDTLEAVVLSSASRVSYVPFSRARAQERLPCLVVRRVGTSGFLACRGSAVGVGTSTDLAQWSTPQGVAPVELVALSGDDVWSCGRHKVIAAVGASTAPATAKARTVPSEMRIPYLLTAFTM